MMAPTDRIDVFHRVTPSRMQPDRGDEQREQERADQHEYDVTSFIARLHLHCSVACRRAARSRHRSARARARPSGTASAARGTAGTRRCASARSAPRRSRSHGRRSRSAGVEAPQDLPARQVRQVHVEDQHVGPAARPSRASPSSAVAPRVTSWPRARRLRAMTSAERCFVFDEQDLHADTVCAARVSGRVGPCAHVRIRKVSGFRDPRSGSRRPARCGCSAACAASSPSLARSWFTYVRRTCVSSAYSRAPDRAQDHRVREHLAGVRRQVLEQGVLGRRQVHLGAIAARRAGARGRSSGRQRGSCACLRAVRCCRAAARRGCARAARPCRRASSGSRRRPRPAPRPSCCSSPTTDRTMIGVSCLRRSSRQTSTPLMSGSIRSSRTTSGLKASNSRRPRRAVLGLAHVVAVALRASGAARGGAAPRRRRRGCAACSCGRLGCAPRRAA